MEVNGVGCATELTNAEINRALGIELQEIRKRLGWSKKEVAARMSADASHWTVASWENAKRALTIPKFVDLCEALGVAPSAVMASAMRRCRIEVDGDSPKRRRCRITA